MGTLIVGIVFIVMILDKIRTLKYVFHSDNYNNFIKNVSFNYSILFTIIIIVNALIIGSIKKTDFGNLGYFLLLFQYFGVVSFIYAWTSNSTIWKIIGTIPIVILFISGARAYAVIAVISLVMILFYNQKIFSMKSLKLIVIGFIVLLASFVPRYGSRIIEAKNKGTLISYLSIMIGSYEFGQISYNLNVSVDPNYKSKHTLKAVLIGSIPIANRFLMDDLEMRRFHEHIERYLNPGFGYALGGTFWGESYVIGGIGGVIINLLLIFLFIEWLIKRIFSGNVFYPLYMLTLVFFVFYLPRNDIFIMIAVVKNLLIFLLIYHISFKLIPKYRIPKVNKSFS